MSTLGFGSCGSSGVRPGHPSAFSASKCETWRDQNLIDLIGGSHSVFRVSEMDRVGLTVSKLNLRLATVR